MKIKMYCQITVARYELGWFTEIFQMSFNSIEDLGEYLEETKKITEKMVEKQTKIENLLLLDQPKIGSSKTYPFIALSPWKFMKESKTGRWNSSNPDWWRFYYKLSFLEWEREFQKNSKLRPNITSRYDADGDIDWRPALK